MLDAIRAAHAGRPTLAPEAAQALIQVARAASASPAPGFDLTDREREILELMVEGLTNPEIAKRLFVSRSTIKFHVSNILSKLGASSRTEAASIAMQKKIIS